MVARSRVVKKNKINNQMINYSFRTKKIRKTQKTIALRKTSLKNLYKNNSLIMKVTLKNPIRIKKINKFQKNYKEKSSNLSYRQYY